VNGTLVREDTSLAEGWCPRCGARPFHIDCARVYVNDIRKMSIEKAVAFCERCETQDEVEALMRVEIWGPDRYEVIEKLLHMYEFLDFEYHMDPLPMIHSVEETREIIKKEDRKNSPYAQHYMKEDPDGSQ
jgi:hypothetical protein